MKKWALAIVVGFTLTSLTLIGGILAMQNTPELIGFLPPGLRTVLTKLNNTDSLRQVNIVSGKEVKKAIKAADENTAIFVHNVRMGSDEENTLVPTVELLLEKHPGWLVGIYSQIWEVENTPAQMANGESTKSKVIFINYGALLATNGSFHFMEDYVLFTGDYAYGSIKDSANVKLLFNDVIDGIDDKSSPEHIQNSAKYIELEILDSTGKTFGKLYYEMIK